MKVLVVSDSYPPRPDGIAQSTAALLHGLDGLGHELTIVVPRDTSSETGTRHVHRVRTAPFQIASYPVVLATQRAFSHVADPFQPDVIHVQTLARLGMVGAMYAQRRRVPAVLTWHTDVLAYRTAFPVLNIAIPATYLAWHKYSAPAALLAAGVVARSAVGLDVTNEHALMLAAVISSFDVVIAPSAKAARQVKLIIGDKTEIATIPSAVLPETTLSTVDETILENIRRELPRTGRSIVFVGRPSPEKNLDTLLHALQRVVVPRCPGVELIVVGSRPGDELRYKRLATTLGIGSAVRFIGAVPNPVLRQLLRYCAALVMPSQTETQGLVLAEAALAGVPSVIADASLDGIVENEKTGLVASSVGELGEAICRLILNPELCSQLGHAACRRAVSYSPLSFANRVVDSYRVAQSLNAPRVSRAHLRRRSR